MLQFLWYIASWVIWGEYLPYLFFGFTKQLHWKIRSVDQRPRRRGRHRAAYRHNSEFVVKTELIFENLRIKGNASLRQIVGCHLWSVWRYCGLLVTSSINIWYLISIFDIKYHTFTVSPVSFLLPLLIIIAHCRSGLANLHSVGAVP